MICWKHVFVLHASKIAIQSLGSPLPSVSYNNHFFFHNNHSVDLASKLTTASHFDVVVKGG